MIPSFETSLSYITSDALRRKTIRVNHTYDGQLSGKSTLRTEPDKKLIIWQFFYPFSDNHMLKKKGLAPIGHFDTLMRVIEADEDVSPEFDIFHLPPISDDGAQFLQRLGTARTANINFEEYVGLSLLNASRLRPLSPKDALTLAHRGFLCNTI